MNKFCKNFSQYLETTMVSKKILRMGFQKTPIQKTYEIAVDYGSITTIHASYNAELATKYIKSVKLVNFTEIFRLPNEKNMTWTI